MNGRTTHQPIRTTPTNAGPDSKGIVTVFGWDLEGMVAFYLVAGALAGMLVVFSLQAQSIWTRLGAGAVPVAAAAIWIKVFVHGRPPGYQSDVFEATIRGPGFRLNPQGWCRKRHPRVLLLTRLEAEEVRRG